MNRGLETSSKFYSNTVKWIGEKVESVSAIMKVANAKRRNVPVREKAAQLMREKRLDDDYRKEGNAVHVEYLHNLPEEADDARRGQGHRMELVSSMVGPEIRKELQRANPNMHGQEFCRLWGKEVRSRWRALTKDEKKPYKDREAADEIRYKNEIQFYLMRAEGAMDDTVAAKLWITHMLSFFLNYYFIILCDL
uniref:HMG box domain-containing protein n=1 Tax=Panagrolaimus sp. ES5 TaxID=591445 RepID=A0AC34FTN3_9BILA